MSTVVDVPEALGDFMLKGYVLTDQSCPTPGCAIPMMRTPRGMTPVLTFCVKCSKEQAKAAKNPVVVTNIPPTSNTSTESHASRSSTPLTEVSAIPSSPDFELPPESEETRRRREQSDRASSELGKKLLQGWAMLGDECPNDSCYGVPLVRPPKVGEDLNPRKVCVICGGIWKSEIDWAGRDALVPFAAQVERRQPASVSNTAAQQPATTSLMRSVQKDDHLPLVASSGAPIARRNYVKDIPPQDVSGTLDEAATALQHTLSALSQRLTILSSQTHLDVQSISATADSMSKVSQALAQVRQLQ